MALVRNHSARIHALPCGSVIPTRTLDVPDALLEKLMQRPAFRAYVESGELEIVAAEASAPERPTVAPKPRPRAPKLTSVDEGPALALVAAEEDRRTLRAWAKADKRPFVLEAIEARMIELASAADSADADG